MSIYLLLRSTLTNNWYWYLIKAFTSGKVYIYILLYRGGDVLWYSDNKQAYVVVVVGRYYMQSMS